MFKFFQPNTNQPRNLNHAVIIEGEFESGDEFGTDDERQQVSLLEERLASSLDKETTDVDGHDIGEGNFTVYVYTVDADDCFLKMEDILKKTIFNNLLITKRYGSAEDSDSTEKKFSL